MAHLELKGVHKVYPNGFHAVHNFNIEIEKGEFIVFVGPSGCGKSTTLRMIAGLEDISRGKFYINGNVANKMTPRERGIAMVFQSYALYPHLSVYDNMAFGLDLQGVDEDIIEKKVKKAAKILGLIPYLDRKPRELSGGQRQRVAVGRAIVRHVEVFLMDEPLSNLDAKQRVTMRSEIIAIHKRVGATTIYVTHDQTEAMTMADRIVVMKDGYVQQIGSPETLYYNPINKFVAGFIGEPPMNFLPCTYEKGEFDFEGVYHIKDGGYFLKYIKEDISQLIFGFRPEAGVLLKDGQKADDCAMVFEGKVELTELLGDNANVYISLGKFNIIIKVAPEDEPKMGDSVKFAVFDKNIFLFDRKTEFSLMYKEE